MKKIIALLLTTGVLVCSSLPSQAASHNHNFTNPTNVSAYTTTYTHQYVYAYYPDGSVVYKDCTVTATHKVFQLACAQCGALDGNSWEEVSEKHGIIHH